MLQPDAAASLLFSKYFSNTERCPPAISTVS